MRRNLLMALSLAALVSLAAGDYVFNRLSGAQDAPKKAEPDEKKSNLFDLLKKELDAKKDSDAVPAPLKDSFPSPVPADMPKPSPLDGLPIPQGVVQTGAQEKGPLPPVVSAPTPGPLPLPQGKPDETKPVQKEGPPIPAPTATPPAQVADPLPPVNVGPPPVAPQPSKLALPLAAPMPIPKSSAGQPPSLPSAPPTLPTPNGPPIGDSPMVEPVPNAQPKDMDVKPEVGTGGWTSPRTNVLPPATSVSPSVAAKPEPAKTKTSPWTLHIEIVDDMTIVTATVNKKHEFKVVCQNLEVMTGKDAFKASGKVKITGDSINGSCERLAISLTDDRLVLEGGAEVQIQKTITQVSSDDGKPAAFELKGETLNLRISELQSGKILQAKWEGSVNLPSNETVTPRTSGALGEGWSKYGKLVQTKAAIGGAARYWLENSNGTVIFDLAVVNDTTLRQYVGRTISVYGQIDGKSMRVTHIAVP